MRKSLNELQQIEAYLRFKLDEQERQNFQIRMLLDPALQKEVDLQEQAYAHIKEYGRNKLKKELQAIHENLFRHPGKKTFRQKIKELFT